MGNNNQQPTFSVAAKNGLNLRTEPGGDIIAVLPFGELVKEISRDGAWAQVRCGRRRGWVMVEYLREAV